MKTVLLVIESQEFCQRIAKALKSDYNVLVCNDTDTASDLMHHNPDAMILQLDLPCVDGLTFLESLSWKPGVMLSLSVNYTPYSAQKLRDLGVGYSLRMPCTLRAVLDRFHDLMKEQDSDQWDDQSIISGHLQRLGIPCHDKGGKQLRVAIPLYAQDPQQKISGELYPAVAKICGSTPRGVEHAMRRSIMDAWDQRDPKSWAEYFPRRKRYPSTKIFISALAEELY